MLIKAEYSKTSRGVGGGGGWSIPDWVVSTHIQVQAEGQAPTSPGGESAAVWAGGCVHACQCFSFLFTSLLPIVFVAPMLGVICCCVLFWFLSESMCYFH